MITDLKTISGCTLCATDGELGAVEDFYFDAAHWHLRYFVADVGAWLRSRRVLISPEAIGEPCWGEEMLPVNLTKDQIRHSPHVDTARPVERAHEIALQQHYGWAPYWGMTMADEPIAVPMPIPPIQEEPADPHLHSARHLLGYRIEATDGHLGHVDNILIGDADWRIHYLVADTRDWWPHRRVLLAPGWIRQFSRDQRQVVVDLTCAQIESSPAYDPHQPLHAEYTESLHAHYGQPHYPDWDASPDDPVTRNSSGTPVR